MRAGQNLDMLGDSGIAGDRTVVPTVKPDQLGESMRVTGVTLGTGNAMPLPVTRGLQRIDCEHRVAGRQQRLHPRTPIGLDPDHHSARVVLII